MKSNGYAENTLKTTDYKLRQIARQCDINNPEQVKAYIASLPVTNATKHKLTVAYDNYAKINNIQWSKPQYKVPENTPLIPTTENVEAIISNASKKYVTIFTISKK
jgi:hypothetical protein